MSETIRQPQIGSFDWAEATSGRLTAADRRSFLGPALRQSVEYTVGRLRLALGLRSGDAGRFVLADLELPDSELAMRAEAEAKETLTPATLNHSYRTFVYGLALAQLDGVTVDTEHLYATALMHDIALETPDASACFAVRGGRSMHALALEVGTDEQTARKLAEAIIHHITPGIGDELGPLPSLIQSGAMVDLTGLRLCDLSAPLVDEVLARYPRHDLKRQLGTFWRAEATAFPEGRAAHIEKLARFSLLVRLAPFSE